MTPFWRCAGGSYLSVLTRCGGIDPSSASVSVSSGFFFAFMMSGSFT